MMHVPRPDGRSGGGVGLMYKNSIGLTVKDVSEKFQFKQFESSTLLISSRSSTICMSIVYRPQPTRINKLKVKQFWKDWTKFLVAHTEQNYQFVITGDLNFHLDISDDNYTLKFNSILSEFGLKQLISEPTHEHGHTLDVLIIQTENPLATNHEVTDLGFVNDSGIPLRDHLSIKFTLKVEKKKFKPVTVKTRNWKNLDPDKFNDDLKSCVERMYFTEQMGLSERVNWYNTALSELVNKHAPEKTKTISRKPNPWYCQELEERKRKCRQLERKWRKSKLTVHLQIFRKECSRLYNRINFLKISFNKDLVSTAGRDQKKIFSIANRRLLGKRRSCSFPTAESDQQCANKFSAFFSDKVAKIHSDLTKQKNELLLNNPGLIEELHQEPTSSTLACFRESNETEVLNYIGL